MFKIKHLFQHKSNEETNEITTVWGEKTEICQIRYILRNTERKYPERTFIMMVKNC